METIKWISERMPAERTQRWLNLYCRYLIPESVQVIKVGNGGDVLVTFMLSQTFNSSAELDKALKEKPVF